MAVKKAPFKNGSLMDWTSAKEGEICPAETPIYSYWYSFPTEWRDVAPFYAELKCITYERGRSAYRLIFEDDKGNRYPMFPSAIMKLLQKAVVEEGIVAASWIVVKRGQNYGIEVYTQSDL